MNNTYHHLNFTLTALTAVHNDLKSTVNADCIIVLKLLDLSSVFGTADHDMLLLVRLRRCGIDGIAL